MIIAANAAFSQKTAQFYPQPSDKKASFSFTAINFYQPKSASAIPANFYCTQLGFFCRKEIKLENATKIPFKFRLGSIPYNDWMEGKINSGLLPDY